MIIIQNWQFLNVCVVNMLVIIRPRKKLFASCDGLEK